MASTAPLSEGIARNALVACCALLSSLAGAPVAAEEGSFRAAYRGLRDAAYDQSEPIERTRERYRSAIGLAGADSPGEKARRRRLSRVEYMAGRAEQGAGNFGEATVHYESCLAWARASLQLGADSEGYRMMAEAVSQMCLTRGPAYLLANGRSVLRYADESIALDENSGGARIILAAAKIYPPALFGGDPRRGMEILKLSMGMPDIEKDDLFNIYCGMGVACSRLRLAEEAASWLERARGLYPGNRFVSSEYERLRR